MLVENNYYNNFYLFKFANYIDYKLFNKYSSLADISFFNIKQKINMYVYQYIIAESGLGELEVITYLLGKDELHDLIKECAEKVISLITNEDLSEKEAIKNVTEDDKLHKIMNKILREIKLINIKIRLLNHFFKNFKYSLPS